MADVVVVEGEGNGGEPVAGAVAADTAEAIADAAVQVAEIEAARDVELAEIHTASAEAQNEAVLEAQTNEELEQCRTIIASLEADNLALRSTVATLQETLNTLTLQASQEQKPQNPEAGESAATTVPEAPEAEAAQAPEPKPKPKPKKGRWI